MSNTAAARNAARTLLARGPLARPSAQRLLTAQQRCPQGLPLSRLVPKAARLAHQLAGDPEGSQPYA
ncbi:hypothetical protein [Desulfacinum hydrothermale]|nr:hypothetical protein [Desulfacinum hydrothermale]